MFISTNYLCKYFNENRPQCFQQHYNTTPVKQNGPEKCPLIKHKMLTYIVCDDEGKIQLDWTKDIIYHNVLNEYFIKI